MFTYVKGPLIGQCADLRLVSLTNSLVCKMTTCTMNPASQIPSEPVVQMFEKVKLPPFDEGALPPATPNDSCVGEARRKMVNFSTPQTLNTTFRNFISGLDMGPC